MSSDLSQQEHSIRERVAQSERKLSGLEAELCAIDSELEALAEHHHKYEALAQICESLQQLDAEGAGHLFWGDDIGREREERLRHAKCGIDDFHAEIADVEKRRDALIAKIEDHNVQLDYLHYDLQDIIEREENRKNEWLLERDDDALPFRALVMPWTRGCQEDQRFRQSLATSLAASIAIAILLSMIAIPIKDRKDEMVLPERVAKLVRQERLPPPPPATEPELPDEQPEPEPELVEEVPPEPVPGAKQQVAETQPDTREQVKSKGILAFRDSFANRADIRPTARLGSQARVRAVGDDATGRPERMMVTTSAPGSSGGINLASISRDFGGGGGDGIEGVQLSRVASSIGGGDGPDRPLAAGAAAGRTDEEIQIVFDRYKAALYRLYNRELRKDPTLRGQLVLRLTIEPDGSVSLCQLHSSTMDAPLLADQVLERVLDFDFGAKEDIVAVTIIYPIDFLPAA